MWKEVLHCTLIVNLLAPSTTLYHGLNDKNYHLITATRTESNRIYVNQTNAPKRLANQTVVILAQMSPEQLPP